MNSGKPNKIFNVIIFARVSETVANKKIIYKNLILKSLAYEKQKNVLQLIVKFKMLFDV